MADNKDVLVVVLTRNYSTGLSVIRSLGEAGYTVDMVASAIREGRSEVAACSKFVRNSVEVVSKKVKDGGDRPLIEELLKYKDHEGSKPVLFPTDDYTAAIMDMNRDELEDIFIMPGIVGGGQGSMTYHMDKTVQGEIARRVGLPTPKEWIVSLRDERAEVPEDVTYPVFCKPMESITGYKKEMKACVDEVDLRSHLNRLRRIFSNRDVLVQEFLEIDNEIDLGGVCFDDEVIIPAIIKKTNVAQYEKGVTLAGKVYPFEDLGDLQEKVIALLKEFHYFGMFDMELNIVGDKIYFNEVNFRSGGPNFSYFRSGVNLPALFVKKALGEEPTEEEKKVEAYGKSFIYEKVAWDDYMNGFMTKKELNECIAAADITLLGYDNDPAPGEYFEKNIKKTITKKKLRGVKKTVKSGVIPTLRQSKAVVLRYPQTKKKNARDPEAARPRVLVAGRNYCSNLTMARSLGMAGYEVEVLRIFQKKPKWRKNPPRRLLKPDAYSKYVKAFYICISNRKSRRVVNKLISLADPERKMLLIPCDDLVAYIADDYQEELKDYYILPNINNEPGAITHMMAKQVQKELAIAAGLPVVNSCVIKTVGGEFEIPDTVTYPCFMKPNISKNSSKGRMRKCENENELRGYLTEFSAKKDIEMLVEDYVEIGKEYSLLGVSTKDGANGPGFFVAEEGGHEEHRGVAILGRLLDCDDYRELIDSLIRFMESLNYNGLYDIDLIETKDGKMYFVEINMRFGASGYAVTESGVNLPGMFADYMYFGKKIDKEAKIEPGKTFVSEKVLIEEYMMGRLSKKEYDRIMEEADIHFVKNDEDPQAYKHFRKMMPVIDGVRKVYQIRAAREEAEEEATN